MFRSFAPPVFADEEAFHFIPISVAGSGGMHLAAEDGVYTLLGNPALLSSVTQSMYFALSGGIGDVYQNGKIGATIPPAYYTVAGPFAFGVVSKGIGFGFFNYIRFHENGLDAHFTGNVGFDFILINTPGIKLDLGIAPRFLLSYMQEKPTMLAAATVTPGLLCSLGDRFSLGISYNDAASAAYYMEKSDAKVTRINASLNAGIAAGLVSTEVFGLTVYTDYHDVLRLFSDNTGDPLQPLGVGARIDFRTSFWLLLGMFELAPTVGIGFNLGAIKVEAAFISNGLSAGIKMVRD